MGKLYLYLFYTRSIPSSVFTCIGALGTPTPAERGPSLESIYRVSLTADLREGNKITSFLKIYFITASWGPLKKKKKSGALCTCPICPLVKTALSIRISTEIRLMKAL